MFITVYSRLCLIYPCAIETVKDWADCEQLTPIEVGLIFVKIPSPWLFLLHVGILSEVYYIYMLTRTFLKNLEHPEPIYIFVKSAEKYGSTLGCPRNEPYIAHIILEYNNEKVYNYLTWCIQWSDSIQNGKMWNSYTLMSSIIITSTTSILAFLNWRSVHANFELKFLKQQSLILT